MFIKIKNLGVIKQAEFTLGDLTVICGANNTGKTYATYALYGFLSFWREMFSIEIPDPVIGQLLSGGTVRLDLADYIRRTVEILGQACASYSKELPMVFAAPAERFRDSEFRAALVPGEARPLESYSRRFGTANAEFFDISKPEDSDELNISLLVDRDSVKFPRHVIAAIIGSAIKDAAFGAAFPRPFIASAERTGAAIFRKELNFARNRLLEEISQGDKNLNPIELLTKVYQDYALPVKVNVDFTRQLETHAKQTSVIQQQHPEVLERFGDIIGGRYSVTRNDELHFVPARTRVNLSMDESSSAVRSLLDIGFYLRHIAKPGDLLMVDEPELNLHPENQRRVARLFSRLIRLGVKVFITTHSDYIIKELNTLIMLNGDRPHLKRIASANGYEPEELLDSSRVKVFIAEEAMVLLEGNNRKTRCQTLTEADINPQLGIEVRSFDATINEMNRIQDDIVWGGGAE